MDAVGIIMVKGRLDGVARVGQETAVVDEGAKMVIPLGTRWVIISMMIEVE